jgi:hypothetical protein
VLYILQLQLRSNLVRFTSSGINLHGLEWRRMLRDRHMHCDLDLRHNRDSKFLFTDPPPDGQ